MHKKFTIWKNKVSHREKLLQTVDVYRKKTCLI